MRHLEAHLRGEVLDEELELHTAEKWELKRLVRIEEMMNQERRDERRRQRGRRTVRPLPRRGLGRG